MEEKKQGKLRTVIIALAVLLALSLLVLAGTLIHNHNSASQPTSVVIPDNVITPTDDPADSSQTEDPSAEDPSGNSASQNGAGTLPAGNSAANNAAGSTVSIVRTATALYLDKSNPGINAPFQASNMFPGDNVIKNYRIRVYHRGNVVLRFHAAVRPGYEKLAEVMKCKVRLNTGETLYDGLMRDMPSSVPYTVTASQSTASDIYYEITAYLDTSVGNEYMNQELKADFRWWVEERVVLEENPSTGDSFPIALWSGVAAGSLFLIILLGFRRRKEEQANEAQQ